MQNESQTKREPIATTVGVALLGPVSRQINFWSGVFFLAALLLFVGVRHMSLTMTLVFAGSFTAALGQMYFALRCSFDAEVFVRLGANDARYAEFDQLLVAWRAQHTSHTTRTLEHRINGALRLLLWQGILWLVQLIMLLVAVVLFRQGN